LQMNETHILIRLLRMYVYSTELGIRLSFGKTSEFRGGGGWTPQTLPPSVRPCSARHRISQKKQITYTTWKVLWGPFDPKRK
jgi:hypothetical protein